MHTRFLRVADSRLRPLWYRRLYGFEQEPRGFASCGWSLCTYNPHDA